MPPAVPYQVLLGNGCPICDAGPVPKLQILLCVRRLLLLQVHLLVSDEKGQDHPQTNQGHQQHRPDEVETKSNQITRVFLVSMIELFLLYDSVIMTPGLPVCAGVLGDNANTADTAGNSYNLGSKAPSLQALALQLHAVLAGRTLALLLQTHLRGTFICQLALQSARLKIMLVLSLCPLASEAHLLEVRLVVLHLHVLLMPKFYARQLHVLRAATDRGTHLPQKARPEGFDHGGQVACWARGCRARELRTRQRQNEQDTTKRHPRAAPD
mmetsp:Transcript_22548/g.67665  ORF Transcript_22548/g.67665 Transcript_22548/m.67665 type:complete len:269 (+) Transcript_22548:340-1146(+)